MSIAATVVIRPSSLLQNLVYGFCGVILMAIALMVSGLAGSLSIPARLAIGVTGLVGVTVGLLAFRGQQKTWRMHISSEGVMRLLEESAAPLADDKLVAFRMMPDSSLWPGVMLLHLQSETGQRVIVRVFRDSVAPHEYRALSVALRWIAARSSRTDDDLSG